MLVDKRTGVVAALDYKVRELQGEPAVLNSQNVLIEDDVHKLYKPHALPPSMPHGFMT